MGDANPRYEHDQRAPLHLLLHLIAAAMIVAAWSSMDQPWLAVLLASVGGLFSLLGLMFARLTVRDWGDSLSIRYGPLPLFGTSVRYSDILSVRRSRSSLIDGWGIHWIPGRGWTFNLWGFDCVVLDINGRTLRIGTDDADELARFLQGLADQNRDADLRQSRFGPE